MTHGLKTQVLDSGPAAISEAGQRLASGGLIAFPTETVYGLGADATNPDAVARLYRAKGRPAFNPLIAHVASIDDARRLARFNDDAEALARAFWPGALTLVLPKTPDCPVCDLATAGLETIAIRIPDHPVARALIAEAGRPIVAPSANLSGHVSPTTAQHVLADLDSQIDGIVDGGPTKVGVESTIVACLREPTLLRPGGLARSAIEQALGHELAIDNTDVAVNEADAPLAPGMLASHYAPRARIRLNARDVRPGEALLAFGPELAQGAEQSVKCLNLSVMGDLAEAAANLFGHMRTLDASGAATIAVMPIPAHDLGEAINDRLRRGAAPK